MPLEMGRRVWLAPGEVLPWLRRQARDSKHHAIPVAPSAPSVY